MLLIFTTLKCRLPLYLCRASCSFVFSFHTLVGYGVIGPRLSYHLRSDPLCGALRAIPLDQAIM